MNQPDDEQIKPERFNMRLLDFLVNHQYYWSIAEITEKASEKTQKYDRVKKAMIYFANKQFVKKFSDLSSNEQQKEINAVNRDISIESYKITDDGIEVCKKIKESCLDSVGGRLLGFKKIE